MKILGLLFLFITFSIQVKAQSPQVPKGEPGKVPLPTPAFKSPPDLTISCSNAIGTIHSIADGYGKRDYTTYIKVRIIVTNAGQLRSKPVTVVGLMSPNPSNRTSVTAPPARFGKEKTNIGSWLYCGLVGVEIDAIEPGASIIKECDYQFLIRSDLTGTGNTFFFTALVDYYQNTSETNRTNNVATPIAVSNPSITTKPGHSYLKMKL